MDNVRRGQYDPGAIVELPAGQITEAAIALTWVNELRQILRLAGHTVIRTRRDEFDPAPVYRRDDIARAYQCQRMLSIHCNAASGQASGTECYYRGAEDQTIAARLSAHVANALALPDRGAKTEQSSQHRTLAVMEFERCWLLELGFLDNSRDRAALLDPNRRAAACRSIAQILVS